MIKACRNEGELKRVDDFLNRISSGNDAFGFSIYSSNALLLQLKILMWLLKFERKNWRVSYNSLILLDHLLTHGPESIAGKL